ncbi:MAG: hypothetical protein N2235_03825 [Fischerella sp.]|nr:hypothetical protein [Fischerella sp.]
MVWISKPRKQFQVKSDLYFRIDETLHQQNIQIPFPQRSLHLRSGSLPLQVSPQLENSLSQLSEGLITWLKNQSQFDKLNGSIHPSTQNHARDD